MQLNKIELENFRVFKNAEIEIKPITIITGANSSGKSSVFKALMLLNENISQSNLTKLDFSTGSHTLGGFDSVRNIKSNDDNSISFSLCFEFEEKQEVIISLTFNKDEQNGTLSKFNFKIDKNEILNISEKDKSTSANLNFNWFCQTKYKYKYIFDNLFSRKFEDFIPEYVFEDYFKKTCLDEMWQDYKNNQANWTQKEKKVIENLEKKKEEELLELEKNTNVAISKITSEKEYINWTEDEKLEEATLRDDYEATKKEIEEKYSMIPHADYIHEDDGTVSELGFIPKEVFTIIHNKLGNKSNKNLKSFINEEKIKIKEFIFYQIIQSIQTQNKVNINTWQTDLEECLLSTEINLFEDKKMKFIFSDDEYFKLSYLNDSETEISNQEIIKLENNEILDLIFKEYLYPFINISKKLLPFTHIPAIRGKQGRVINFSMQNDTLEENIHKLSQINYNRLRTDKTKVFIETWLDKFEIGKIMKLQSIDSSSAQVFIHINTKDKKGRNIADFGLGISQLIPIILTCANPDNKGKLICIEEPETNLHPKFQSMLAEMFVEANKEFSVQFALETHSEYLIRKVQELVGKGKIQCENSLIYYFSKPENLEAGKNQMEKIEFDKEGNIDHTKFDTGFYDQDYVLEFGLLNNQRKRFFEILKQLKQTFKNSNDSLEQEEQELLTIIKTKIDGFIETIDFRNYENKIKNDLNENQKDYFSELNCLTQKYLSSAEFLFNTNHEEGDFSPVIAQFGRAVEHELVKLLDDFKAQNNYYQNLDTNLLPAKVFRLLFEKGELESKLVGKLNSLRRQINFTGSSKTFNDDFSQKFSSWLSSIKFNSNYIRILIGCSPINKKLYQKLDNTEYPDKNYLDHVQGIRNLSAHTGETFTQAEAKEYKDIVIDFFKLWCTNLYIPTKPLKAGDILDAKIKDIRLGMAYYQDGTMQNQAKLRIGEQDKKSECYKEGQKIRVEYQLEGKNKRVILIFKEFIN